MGRLQTDQVFRLKDREGFLLNFTFGKTNCAGLSRPFALLRIPNVPVCPVFWLNYYIAACKALGVPLLGEYLFRASEHKKAVSHRPLGGSAVSTRLRKYLKPLLLTTKRPLIVSGWDYPIPLRIWAVPLIKSPSMWVGGVQRWRCIAQAALAPLFL